MKSWLFMGISHIYLFVMQEGNGENIILYIKKRPDFTIHSTVQWQIYPSKLWNLHSCHRVKLHKCHWNVNWRDVDLNEISLWVRAMGLPPGMVTIRNAQRVASAAGTVSELKIDNRKDVIFKNFFRFKVVIMANSRVKGMNWRSGR